MDIGEQHKSQNEQHPFFHEMDFNYNQVLIVLPDLTFSLSGLTASFRNADDN